MFWRRRLPAGSVNAGGMGKTDEWPTERTIHSLRFGDWVFARHVPHTAKEYVGCHVHEYSCALRDSSEQRVPARHGGFTMAFFVSVKKLWWQKSESFLAIGHDMTTYMVYANPYLLT